MLVAVLCGAMAGVPLAVGAPGSMAGAGQAASGSDSDSPSARKPSATRIDPLEDFANYLGSDDTPSALLTSGHGGQRWGKPAPSAIQITFDLPVRFGLVRDGLTRGPPSA